MRTRALTIQAMRHALDALRVHLEMQAWSPALDRLLHGIRNSLQALHIPEGLTDEDVDVLLERAREQFDTWNAMQRSKP